MAPKRAKTELSSITFDADRYVKVLGSIMGESEKLQNSPPQGLIPRENYCSDHVLAALEPYTNVNGGPIIIERIAIKEGRGNVIIKYPGTDHSKSVAIIGSHISSLISQLAYMGFRTGLLALRLFLLLLLLFLFLFLWARA